MTARTGRDKVVVALKQARRPTQEQEINILDGCRQGDPVCWEHLYLGYRQEVLHALIRILGPCNDLEDLVQTVFIRLHRRLESFEGRSSFSTWLRGVCSYVALEYLRKKRRNREVLDDSIAERREDPRPNPCSLAVDKQMLSLFHLALKRLKKKKRNVLVMHDIMDIPTHDIAWMMNVPPATVRTRLFHARKEMARRMARLCDGGAP